MGLLIIIGIVVLGVLLYWRKKQADILKVAEMDMNKQPQNDKSSEMSEDDEEDDIKKKKK